MRTIRLDDIYLVLLIRLWGNDRMKMEDLLVYVIPADIPESYQPIIHLIGIDSFVKLCNYCMGDEIYIPTTDTILKRTRNRKILEEYNGYNIKELSQKYEISTNQVKNIVKGSNQFQKV